MSTAQLPSIKTEVAFSNGARDTALTWVDITPYVLPGRTGRRGRSSESDTTQTGVRSLRLRNVDGRFDPGNAASPYNLNGNHLRPMRPIRQTAILPDGTSGVVFSGFVLGWPQTWTRNGRYGETPIQCVDMFRALQAYKFGLRYFEQVVGDGATYYYRMIEGVIGAAGANSLGTWASSGSIATSGSWSQNVVEGSGTYVAAPQGADEAARISYALASNRPDDATATSPGNFVVAGAPTISPAGAATMIAAELWWRPESIPATTGLFQRLIGGHRNTAGTGPTFACAEVRFDTGDAYFGVRYDNPAATAGAGTFVAGSTAVVPTANQWHHIVLRTTFIGTNNVKIELFVNGVKLLTTSNTNVGAQAQIESRAVGAWNVPAGFAYQLGEWAIYNQGLTDAQIANHYAFASTFAEFPAQLSGTRVNQILDTIGWPSAARTIDAGTVTLQATGTLNGKTALEVLQAAADAEIGNIFATGAGKVAFTDRNHAYTAAPAFTLGDGPGELPYLSDFTIVNDDQRIINDWTITQDGSNPPVVSRAFDTTNLSQNDYFPRADSKTFPYATASDVAAAAAYLLARTKDSHPRIDTVTLDVASNPALLAAYAGLEIGQWVRVNRRPPYAPQITVDSIVEQIAETADVNVLKLTLSLSPKL